ncbi:MAG: 4Fe-4S dicluster domain-containing protein [Cytophagales bacterium]
MKLLGYFNNILTTTNAIFKGMKLTLKHAFNARSSYKHISVSDSDYFTQNKGIVTLEYPKEKIPVPTNGRYQLHNEIDDCIVCDKCAKICPVDCIDIEPIKSPTEIGITSDGTSKRLYAAVFDIDMAKCCFCGLCTTVCPTECLTMTPEYDFSVTDISKLNFGFGNLSEEEIIEKKEAYEAFQASKAEKKQATAQSTENHILENENKSKVSDLVENQSTEKKPVFKPKMPTKSNTEQINEPAKTEEKISPENNTDIEKPTAPKPIFKPKMIPKKESTSALNENLSEPNLRQDDERIPDKESSPETSNIIKTDNQAPKPKIKPIMNKTKPKEDGN